jgi:hypothetical protein
MNIINQNCTKNFQKGAKPPLLTSFLVFPPHSHQGPVGNQSQWSLIYPAGT